MSALFPGRTFGLLVVGAAEREEVVERIGAALLERDAVVDGEGAAASALLAVDASAVACSCLRSCVLPGEGVARADGVAGGAPFAATTHR